MVAGWLIVAACVGIGLLFLAVLIQGIWIDGWMIAVAKQHFAAVIGLPAAAVAALFLVIVLQLTSGSIELVAFGIQFRGAAGPVIMWILSFLAISWMVKLLWSV